MNRYFLSHLAALRTRSSALGASTRRGVRNALRLGEFPLGRFLLSPASTADSSAVFGGFVDTTRRSDFPCACIIGVRPRTFRCGLPRARQTPTGSPGSRARRFRTCLRSLTAQGPFVSRHHETTGVAFRLRTRRRRPGGPARRQGSHFAAQSLRLYVPLSTLHVHLRRYPCMTRGRRGWLGLATCDSFIHNIPPVCAGARPW